jgi:hypothetical protein
MNPNQERGGYEEMTTRRQHLIHIPSGAVGPEQVLKNLFGDYQVEHFRKRTCAYVELRVMDRFVFQETHVTEVVSGYLQGL